MKKKTRKEEEEVENEKQKKIIKLLIYDFSSIFLLENSSQCVTVDKFKWKSNAFNVFLFGDSHDFYFGNQSVLKNFFLGVLKIFMKEECFRILMEIRILVSDIF